VSRRLIPTLLLAALFSLVPIALPSRIAPAVAQTTSDPVIAAAGDIACATTAKGFNGGQGTATNCQQKATSDLLVGGGLAAVLPLGDNQYVEGGQSQFAAAYDPSWGRVKSISRPVPGNHEYRSTGGIGYYDYFGAGAGDPAKGYYSFDIGSWHLIALNSECAIIACSAGSEQEQWLKADLAAHSNVCTLAYMHRPRWSSGEGGSGISVAPLTSALYAGNADVVLAGHSHVYERFAPQSPSGALDKKRGLREFVVGTGGVGHGIWKTIRANSEKRNNDTFGVLKLTLHATSYDWQFDRAAGGTFTDSGKGDCH
jgi:hypothetical protein